MARKNVTTKDRAAASPWRERAVMTADEVAHALLISRTSAYELLASGAIPGRLPGVGQVRVSTAVFREYLGEVPGPKRRGAA